MKEHQIIFESGEHKWIVFQNNEVEKDSLIDTNEYMILYNNKGFLIDPGGLEIFPSVFSAVSELAKPDQIDTIFCSQPNPDTISSISLWLEIQPKLKCHVSQLWTTVLPHFGGEKDTFISVPDNGSSINLNGLQLDLIPAHHLHSPGNFHLYDKTAKIYYSGDIGSSVIPADKRNIFVENFKEHIPFIERFHRRRFGSDAHKNDWCERVRSLDIDLLCPHCGSIFQGDDIKRFIDWFYKLKVGLIE